VARKLFTLKSVACGLLMSLVIGGLQSPASGRGARISRATTLCLPLADVRLMNYYPAANGWTYMWVNFDPAVIDQDFGRIAALNFNTVRVSVLVSAFSLVPPPTDTYLSRLSQVIQLADQHGLKVQLSLFDWLADFTAIDPSKRWVDAVVTPYKNDPRIAFIDVHNEIDTSVAAQLAWAQELVPYVKSAAGSIPVTLSVTAQSGLTVAQHLQAVVSHGIVLDLADVHLYGNAASAYVKLQQVRQAAGTLPVFVGETGYSSYDGYQPNATGSLLFGVPPNSTATEAMQAYQLNTISHAVAALQLPMIAPWSYSDFTATAIPPSHVGSNPLEYHFGLLHTDYTQKPAATVMRALNGGSVPSDAFNNGFEQVDAAGLPLLWRLYERPCAGFPAPACGYQADFAGDASVSHTGSASARISNGVNNKYGTPAFYLSPPMPTLPGNVYTLTAYARGNNVSGSARVSISWYSETGCFIGGQGSASLPSGTSDWTQLSVTATLPASGSSQVCAGALPAYVELRMESGSTSPGGGGTVWFDDVSFREGS
jgi:hypothetical protein